MVLLRYCTYSVRSRPLSAIDQNSMLSANTLHTFLEALQKALGQFLFVSRRRKSLIYPITLLNLCTLVKT